MVTPPIPPTPADPSKKPEQAETQPEVLSVTQLEGKTEIDEKLVFEVEALAHVATSHVAAEIADRVDRALGERKPCRVLFLDETLALALSLHRTFHNQCKILEQAFEAATDMAEKGLTALESEKKRTKETTKTKAIIEPLTTAAAGLSAAVNLLGFFNIDTRYYGRSAQVSQQALVMELARKLLEREEITFRWPSLGVAPALSEGKGSLPTHLDDLYQAGIHEEKASAAIHRLSAQVHKLEEDDPRLPPARWALDRSHELHESAAAVFHELREMFLRSNDEETMAPAYLLQLATDILDADEQASGVKAPPNFFLTARVEAAGGSYRIRRHLFQFLFCEDPLTFSGGAVISFALLDASGDLLEAGTLRHRETFKSFAQAGTSFGQESSRETGGSLED